VCGGFHDAVFICIFVVYFHLLYSLVCYPLPSLLPLKEERFMLAQFQRFQSTVSWFLVFRVWWDRTSWQKGVEEQIYCPHGGWEAERRRGRRQDASFQATPRVAYFLQLGSTFYFPLPSNNSIVLWIHQGINPLIRSMPPGFNNFPKAQ
jgi:hypothetical protein